jgi:plastocyanin
MKKHTILAVIIIALFSVNGCATTQDVKQNPPPLTTPNSAQNITSMKIPASNQISIENFSFNPKTITVNKGDMVAWINNDSSTHQLKSKAFNSPNMMQGETFTFTFEETGTFNYLCTIHPSMTGEIIVK